MLKFSMDGEQARNAEVRGFVANLIGGGRQFKAPAARPIATGDRISGQPLKCIFGVPMPKGIGGNWSFENGGGSTRGGGL